MKTEEEPETASIWTLKAPRGSEAAVPVLTVEMVMEAVLECARNSQEQVIWEQNNTEKP